MATINGTSGNDTLTGIPLGDSISGEAGDDILTGLGGNDSLLEHDSVISSLGRLAPEQQFWQGHEDYEQQQCDEGQTGSCVIQGNEPGQKEAAEFY